MDEHEKHRYTTRAHTHMHVDWYMPVQLHLYGGGSQNCFRHVSISVDLYTNDRRSKPKQTETPNQDQALKPLNSTHVVSQAPYGASHCRPPQRSPSAKPGVSGSRCEA